jgi:hypothetical protein
VKRHEMFKELTAFPYQLTNPTLRLSEASITKAPSRLKRKKGTGVGRARVPARREDVLSLKVYSRIQVRYALGSDNDPAAAGRGRDPSLIRSAFLRRTSTNYRP